jgi:hypothetical protein
MKNVMVPRRARRAVTAVLLLIGAGTLAGCVYNPYTGTYVPCCAYHPYGGYAPPSYYGYRGGPGYLGYPGYYGTPPGPPPPVVTPVH